MTPEVEEQEPVKPLMLLMFNSDTAVAVRTCSGGCGDGEIMSMMEHKELMVTHHRTEEKHAGEKLFTLLSEFSEIMGRVLLSKDYLIGTSTKL